MNRSVAQVSAPTSTDPEDGPSPRMQRLVIGRVPDDFDATLDLPLGPWCFLGAEERAGDWANLDFSHTQSTREEFLSATSELHHVIARHVAVWARQLNELHGMDYSIHYWRIVLTPWIQCVSEAVWKRHHIIAKFVEAHEHRKLAVVLSDFDIFWEVRGSLDLWYDVMSGVPFNDWLSSVLLAEMAPAHWIIHRATPEVRMVGRKSPKTKPRTATGVRLREALYARRRCVRVPGFGPWNLLFDVFLSLLPSSAKRGSQAAFDDAGTREPRPTVDQHFDAVLTHVLTRTVPSCLVEEFDELDGIARKTKTKAGKLNIVGPVLALNEDLKYRIAHAADGGEHIVCSQHGGYGHRAFDLGTREIELRHTAFFTWGWNDPQGTQAKLVPLPSPLVSRLRDKHREKRAEGYLIGTADTGYGHRTFGTLQPLDILAYRQRKVDFLSGLNSSVRRHFYYRPHPYYPGTFEDGDFVKRILPYQKICGPEIAPKNLMKRLLSCRVAVVDHPITSICQTLAADIPTVAVWDPDHWFLAEVAQDVYAGMASARMLYTDPEQASKHLNEIWDDVDDWWRDPATRAAREAFVDRFARTSPIWWWHWTKAVWQIR